MKKVFIVVLMLFISSCLFFVNAWSMQILPSEWTFWKWCVFWVDVNIDTEGKDIAAFDLILESSMSFYEFVPSNFLFPYYLPPKVKWNIVHIVWFTADSNNWINWSWSIWKIYFKSNPWDMDWSIRIYFAWEWDTRDSNLSVPWWVDSLSSVKDSYFVFNDEWECLDEHSIVWWLSWVSLDEVMNKIDSDYNKKKNIAFWEKLWVFIASLLILILILAYMYKKWYLKNNKVKISNS